MKIIKIAQVLLTAFILFSSHYANAAGLEKEFARTFEFEQNGQFILSNYLGAVTIRSGDNTEVEVKALIRVNHEDDKFANKLLENTEVVVNESTTRSLSIEIKTDENLLEELNNYHGLWNSLKSAMNSSFGPVLEITFDVIVPRPINLDVRTERGPLDIRGIQGEVKAVNHRGMVHIEDIDGPISVETERADMEILEVTGNIRALNHRGGLQILHAGAAVDAETERAVMELEDIGGNVQAKNHRGEIIARKILGSVKAVTERANVTLGEIAGDIDVINNRGSISIGNARGKVIAETERGDIDAEIAQVDENSELNFVNDRGQISIGLPEGANADISISVERGTIRSDFPLKITGTVSKSSIEGTINDGGIPLTVRNSRGSVELKKL